MEFGYSRDHRPDRPQVNIGLAATADGEVVLPGGSDVHPGSTNDATTTVAAHRQLHTLFHRSDLLVTGDRIMQSAGNMLAIARAHGRFLGPVDWTPYLRTVVAHCPDEQFQPLPLSSQRAGHPIQAAFCHLRFRVKEKLSDQERQQVQARRKQQRKRGAAPKYRETRFRVRAAILLDTARQAADAARRERRIRDYETRLAWLRDHLNRGPYYSDAEWVANRLADLAHDFKDVRTLVRVTFSKPVRTEGGQKEEAMSLTYERQPERIAQAARLDGKWVLVSNQPLCPGQSQVDYMDWMLGVYTRRTLNFPMRATG